MSDMPYDSKSGDDLFPPELRPSAPARQPQTQVPFSRNRSAPPMPGVNDDLMMEHADRLEDESLAYKQLCDYLAQADAEYHRVMYKALVSLPPSVKPAEIRKATAHLAADAEYERWKRLQEEQKSTKQYLDSIRTKIDVMRTIAANYRSQG